MSRKKLLWVKTDAPLPLDKGGKIRSYNMLSHIAGNVNVDYLCFAGDDLQDNDRQLLKNMFRHYYEVKRNHQEHIGSKYIKNLITAHVLGKPFTLYNYHQRSLEDKLNELVAQNTFDAIICDFLGPALNFRPKLRGKAVLFQHNVEHVLWQRQSQQEARFLRKLVYMREYQLIKRFEEDLCRDFNKVVCVSKEDADVIKKKFALSDVYRVDTGVDVEYFKPYPDKSIPKRIVFTGSMDWLPNIDSVIWFSRKILPKIRNKHPEVEFAIVGRNPTKEIVNLSKKDEKIIVTGRVEDVRPWMAQGEVFVVPIRVGGGTRLKIYEAMAMGLAVVSTTVGAEGLSYIEGKNIIIVNDAQAFADEVVALIGNADRRRILGESARNFVVENFSWPRIADQFLSIVFESNNIRS